MIDAVKEAWRVTVDVSVAVGVRLGWMGVWEGCATARVKLGVNDRVAVGGRLGGRDPGRVALGTAVCKPA